MIYSIDKTIYDDVSPTIIPQWEQYLQFLTHQKRQLKNRFLKHKLRPSRAFMMLKEILAQIDIEYLERQPDDLTRYTEYFIYKENVVTTLFDPVKTGRSYRGTFYKKFIHMTNEYICPVENTDHIKTLPFDEPWIEWEKINPVTLWYHDSNEYTLNLLQGKVVFSHNQPSIALIFIDTVALLFKYFKYCSIETSGREDKGIEDFLHRYIFSSFYENLQSIWVLNQIKLVLKNVIVGDISGGYNYYDKEVASDRHYGYKGARYEEAMNVLESRIALVKKGSIKPNNFLNSRLFPEGSLVDKIKFSTTNLDIHQLTQYEYLEILKDLPYVELIFDLYSLRPEHNSFKTLCRSLQVDLDRSINAKIWNRINDPLTKLWLESYLKEFRNKVKK